MKEQIVSLETAKLLKEVGFIGFCRTYYNRAGELNEFSYYQGDGTGVNSLNLEDDYLPEDFYIIAPTQCLAQKWLREKYDKHIIVNPTVFKEYQFTVYKTFDRIIIYPRDVFKTYEQALENGLQKAIKIIKDEKNI